MRDDGELIAVDFDGCLVEDAFPHIGPAVPGAAEVMRALYDAGHRLILWTCRSNHSLLQAYRYTQDVILGENRPLERINSNRLGDEFSGAPKVYADRYIDDKGLGCPKVYPADGRKPYVNWPRVRAILESEGVLPTNE